MACCLFLFCLLPGPASGADTQPSSGTIGVLYVLHGGMDSAKSQYMWDAMVQMFSYDNNHPVYQLVIWNPLLWPLALTSDMAYRFLQKYYFSYERIGGVDPFQATSEKQLADMQQELDNNKQGLRFEVDWVSWLAADHIDHLPYPRFVYNPPFGKFAHVTYCGEREEDGPWEDCDPDRYNVDGPVERLLKKGISRLLMIDMTVGGVRFYKTYDVVQMTRKVLDQWNLTHGTNIPLVWINDYSNLMERSYPLLPLRWTPMKGEPLLDAPALVEGSPNPIALDPELAALHTDGIEARMSPVVSEAETGVFLFAHGLFDANRKYFDPKMDDTITINENIKSLLLSRHPGMDPDNIIGGCGGVKELNPLNDKVEVSRNMRGENLAHAYLHEGQDDMPGEPWGYRYWDGLEYLKNRGVKHIIVGFPHIITSSVLNLEAYNQIGKEIGMKTWAKNEEKDFALYPGVGHPFADYWGVWADTDCGGIPCCFEMGGCSDGRPYPPSRQTPLNQKMSEMDPSLVYDVSAFGHLGYDAALGAPDDNSPVQQQYTGTWEFFSPPDDDPRVGKLLAKHVINAAVCPMVYLTNTENTKGISAGQTVVWDAHVTGGAPDYSFAWSINKDQAPEWQAAGQNSPLWTWTPQKADAGTYSIRCRVTDAAHNAGDVIWNNFIVSAP